MQLGVLNLELGCAVKSIAYLEQALNLAKNELAIR